ncbi:MAG: N-methyl-L-tryptophan oxidase [Aphanocapsa lilacina HA4352-LM1]|jgi:sarcosine oxidase|nr:N-methyl-L-tryptophan oxidase [Aphanocapsa lilacina HA4352-LM1]
MKHHEIIVLGCGGLGSAALYWLARAGADVLGLEQFHHGHEFGGSHDHSRIIRLSYDASEYARLAPYTYTCWSQVEQESGVKLVYRTGGLDISPVEAGVRPEVQDIAETMRATGIPFEEWTPAQTMRHFPQFKLPENVRVIYQADSGLVDARKGTQVHALLARARGAALREEVRVRAVHPLKDSVQVVTDTETFWCNKLVVTAGAWLAGILADLGRPLPITVTREQVTYFKTPHLRDFAVGRFPVWLWYGNREHCFYGFPVYGEVAVKAAEDIGGQPTTPQTRGFEKDERSDASLRSFLGRFLPTMLGPELYTKTCLYDMVADRGFILDAIPGHENILVAHGAAHAFKFASLIGRIMADLALEGRTGYDIGAFRFDRPALSDPHCKPVFKIQNRPLTDWGGRGEGDRALLTGVSV